MTATDLMNEPIHPTRVLPTEAEIADAQHADACPEDPDDGESCTCADYQREARIVLELFADQIEADLTGGDHAH